MQRINISAQSQTVSLQLLDKWYAYKQSQDTEYFKTDVEIVFEPVPKPGYLNIWIEYVPEFVNPEINKYDVILVCNGGEPTAAIITDAMVEILKKDNAYFLCDGYVSKDHPLAEKTIWAPHDALNCHDWWTRSFYPQTFQNYKNFNREKTILISAVNGDNKTWRHNFFSLLKIQAPTIPIRNKWGHMITAIDSSIWDSEQDIIFNDTLKQKYGNQLSQHEKFHVEEVSIGINKTFGTQLNAYIILDDYFDSRCIIYPESVWVNDEICLTEKVLKCFHAKCFPFPIGGRGANQLYNSMGFYTAWNLLPVELQKFDSVEHHETRQQQQIDSIKWLLSNPDVFSSEQAKSMLQSNQLNFLINRPDILATERFDKFIETAFEKHLQK